jgi:hypothetical protein
MGHGGRQFGVQPVACCTPHRSVVAADTAVADLHQRLEIDRTFEIGPPSAGASIAKIDELSVIIMDLHDRFLP